ncbi:hypothetical protein EV363DRAFT_1069442, partial [Boletus edulis]
THYLPTPDLSSTHSASPNHDANPREACIGPNAHRLQKQPPSRHLGLNDVFLTCNACSSSRYVCMSTRKRGETYVWPYEARPHPTQA